MTDDNDDFTRMRQRYNVEALDRAELRVALAKDGWGFSHGAGTIMVPFAELSRDHSAGRPENRRSVQFIANNDGAVKLHRYEDGEGVSTHSWEGRLHVPSIVAEARKALTWVKAGEPKPEPTIGFDDIDDEGPVPLPVWDEG